MTPGDAKALIAAHLPVLVVVVWRLWRWRTRLKRELSLPRWLFALAADCAALATGLLLGIAVLGGFGHLGFLTMRFAAQVLFGEAVLFTAVVSVLHFGVPRTGHQLRWRGALVACAATALVAVYVEAYHRGPYDLQVRHHQLDLARGEKPAGSLRILHLSDLQTHAIRSYERRVFARAASLQPDLIVFTGDYLQSRSRPNLREGGDDFRALIREAGLQPRYGFYATQGDCEDETWPHLFTGLEVTCLSNQSRVIPLSGSRSLVLTALDRRMSRWPERPALKRVLDRAPQGDHHLLVGHAPDFVRVLMPGDRVDLALAGHTHGGQVVIPGFGPPITFSKLPRRYAGGLNLFRDTLLHVSRGIGMERGLAPQVRFLCPPEICLLEVSY